MKNIPVLLSLSVLLWHCSEPPQSTEVPPNPTVQAESLEVSPHTLTDIAPPHSEWFGDYYFENPGGVAGKWGLGNYFHYNIDEDPYLLIASFSMGSRNAEMEVEVTCHGDTLFSRLKKLGEGTGWNDLVEQEPLFYLVRTGEGLITHWQGIRPTYGDLPDKGHYFQAVEKWPHGGPDLRNRKASDSFH